GQPCGVRRHRGVGAVEQSWLPFAPRECDPAEWQCETTSGGLHDGFFPGPVGEEPGCPLDVGKPVERGQFSPVERVRQQAVGDVPARFLDIESYTGAATEGETYSLTRVS